MARPMFRPTLYTAILHISFLIFISFGWHSQPLPKPVGSAGHIQVSMIKASELEKRFPALQKLEKEKLLKQRKIAVQKKQRVKEKQRIAKRRLKRRQELRKRQIIRKKKELEKKRAILLKKAEIKKQKKKQEELRKQKELKREALVKKRRAEKQRVLKKQEQFLKKQALKAVMEKALREQAAQAKEQKQQLQLKLRAEALAATQKAKQNSAEVAILTARIKAMITSRWHIPISAKPGMRVLLKIKLLPTGELNAAVISKSSGDNAYDNSALSAVKSIRNYPVPSDNSLFEQNFRQFYMSFSPQDQITP